MKNQNPTENKISGLRGILFDLDGTLLEVAMEKFIPRYVQGLAAHFQDVAEAGAFYRTMVAATFALLQSREAGDTNEALFLQAVEKSLGVPPQTYRARLQSYCADGLAELAPMIRPLPLARRILDVCFSQFDVVVIATNPVFPRPVVEARLAWGGLADYPFHLVTSYENSRFCKPSPAYFEDVLAHVGLCAQECLMVGNDTEHDLAARSAGISTFLVDTWLVDRLDGDFHTDFRGCHEDLLGFLKEVPATCAGITES